MDNIDYDIQMLCTSILQPNAKSQIVNGRDMLSYMKWEQVWKVDSAAGWKVKN